MEASVPALFALRRGIRYKIGGVAAIYMVFMGLFTQKILLEG